MKLNTTLKNTKLRGDKVIWIIVMGLSLISILAVYSSSSALAYRNDTSTTALLLKQSFYVMVGLSGLFVAYLVPVSFYRKISFILYGISCLLLGYVALFGSKINEATRWIDLGPLSFQPSELAKIAVVLYLARILELYQFDRFKDYLLKIILPIGLLCFLSLLGSVSVTVIIASIAFTILVCAGIKPKFLLWTILIGMGVGLLIYGEHLRSGRFNRIDTLEARVERLFTDHEEELSEQELQELKDKNFQSNEAREAIELGGFWGRGLGNSIKKNSLPHAYSDFIFTIIIEEGGLFGGILVVVLYVWFFFRCVVIANSCKKVFPMIVVLGLSSLIILQAIIHIFVNLGIGVVTGQTLPLISLGGTSFLIMSGAVGIILSVNRTVEVKNDQLKKEKLQNINKTETEKYEKDYH